MKVYIFIDDDYTKYNDLLNNIREYKTTKTKTTKTKNYATYTKKDLLTIIECNNQIQPKAKYSNKLLLNMLNNISIKVRYLLKAHAQKMV